jgi:putative nucleotidyltransferase with HDIG domain
MQSQPSSSDNGRTPETPSQDDVRYWLGHRIDSDQVRLPIMPESSTLLLSMSRDDSCTVQDLTDIVQRDPSLAAHLLRVTNSPLYAPRYPVTTLSQAIARLGLAELRRVAITLACQTSVFRVNGWENEVADLLSHSLATALYSIEVARLVRAGEDEAFLCGLLHDVGHAIVLQSLADFEKENLTKLPREWLTEIARDYHTAVGSKLVLRWGLSVRVAEVVAHHHQPQKAPSSTLAIAHLADTLAYGAPNTLELLASDPVLAPLGLEADATAQLFAKRRQVVALAGWLA